MSWQSCQPQQKGHAFLICSTQSSIPLFILAHVVREFCTRMILASHLEVKNLGFSPLIQICLGLSSGPRPTDLSPDICMCTKLTKSQKKFQISAKATIFRYLWGWVAKKLAPAWALRSAVKHHREDVPHRPSILLDHPRLDGGDVASKRPPHTSSPVVLIKHLWSARPSHAQHRL